MTGGFCPFVSTGPITSFASVLQACTPRPRELQVLLIEDNPTYVRLAQEAFAAGITMPHLQIIGDGAEALRYLRKEGPFQDAPRPDLVLLDLSLPKVSGSEVLRAVKSDPELKRIPIIVLTTSNNSSREIAAIYELHANCCVNKPASLDAFIRFIQAVQHFWFEVVTLPSR